MPGKEGDFRAIGKIAKAVAITAAVVMAIGYMKSADADPGNPVVERRVASAATPDPQEEAQKKVWSHGGIWYKNTKYGVRVKLPKSWKGYKVTVSQWSGGGTGPNGEELVEQGPEILIQHPKSTQENPRQGIPIMVFTLKQWEEGLVVRAAPVGPSELARNCRYVFALPPRYNYADVEGVDEVSRIIASDTVEAF